MADFRKMGLPAELQEALAGLGFERLTPIQALALPALRAGRDVIAESRTGSGKTIAFALPLVEKIRIEGRELQALVLCPTRELCTQVATTIRRAGRFKRDLLVTTLVGGEPVFRQVKSLMHGTHVAVATPGRLLDLLGRGKIDFSRVHTVVLDEADRMLDMGFLDAISDILSHTPPERQTALFSATFPAEIETLSARFQKTPERLSAPAEAAPAIEQSAFTVGDDANEILARLLKGSGFETAIVFCNFKHSVEDVTQNLRESGVRADRLHGDLEQWERDEVMARFRNGSTRILVATDVAARGLDVAGLDAVINFEAAKDPATHVHRIGRTGRAGRTGIAITFWRRSEAQKRERFEMELGYQFAPGQLPAAKAGADDRQWETIVLSGGRRAKLRPGDILGALTGEAGGLPGTAIGKIEIGDNVSYIAVDKAHAHRALKSLQAGKVKGRRFLAKLASSDQGRW